jgi:hypothetical protein
MAYDGNVNGLEARSQIASVSTVTDTIQRAIAGVSNETTVAPAGVPS